MRSRAIITILAILSLMLAFAPAVSAANEKKGAEPRVHTVWKGQRLGSIAKRYNVSVAAICHANGISKKEPIHPKQRLIIPARNDKDGSKARRMRLAGKFDEDKKKSTKRSASAKSSPAKSSKKSADKPGMPRVHKVYRGQRLGSIARRYHVTIAAICRANGIAKSDPIHPGDTLLIPGKHDDDGAYARRLRLSGALDAQLDSNESKKKQARSGGDSWRKYKKLPWKRGYMRLQGWNDSWKGYAIGPGNRVLPLARKRISELLAPRGKQTMVHPHLIRLLVKVSDTFGRTLRIVSGWRGTSYVKDSKHKVGRAVDFSIIGVPNEALVEYLRTLGNVGVGYYPNSSFVHLDVRDSPAYWIDEAGPGQAPRYRRAPGE